MINEGNLKMIKQKDVEKCKFFTTTGGDIWRTKKVVCITEVELVNCETGRMETCRVNERSAEKFIPIAIPRITRAEVRKRKPSKKEAPAARASQDEKRARQVSKKQGKKKRGRPSGNSKLKTQNSKHEPRTTNHDRRGCREGKPPSSKYFGVTVHQTKNSGPSYYAQCFRGGKFKGLGIHKIEELAAAAVQKHIGNIEEAERLREIARQKTDTAIKELKGQAGKTRFLCSGCGADYEEKPDKCGKCGGGSFEKI